MSGSSSSFTRSLTSRSVGVTRCAALIYSIHGSFECSFLCAMFQRSFQRVLFRCDIFKNFCASFYATLHRPHGDAFDDRCGATYDGQSNAKQCLEQTTQSVTTLKRPTTKYPYASSILTWCLTLRLPPPPCRRSWFCHDVLMRIRCAIVMDVYARFMHMAFYRCFFRKCSTTSTFPASKPMCLPVSS